jgi:murein DD-endopeptidase MepM/ murein hydrolase activator NlpD
MAMDSDDSTSWVSQKGQGAHWIEIHFGIKRLMSRIIVTPGEKDNYATLKKFNVQFFYKKNWFDFAQVDLSKSSDKTHKWEKKDGKFIIHLGGVDASNFRIYIPEGATYKGYAAIAEIATYIGSARIQYFDTRLKGLYFPIRNGFLPEKKSSYPNAPRTYRGGKHVGLDIYTYHTDVSYDPIPVDKKTPVHAADGGVIIRADWDYKPMTVKEWQRRSAYYQKNPRTFVMRSFGGIQIWIDHGNGIITTYNHLSRIDPDIKVGRRVKRGQQIGFVGNSGLLGEAEGKDYGMHLHFEIWVDSQYLGYGMPFEQVKKYITWIFFPLQ